MTIPESPPTPGRRSVVAGAVWAVPTITVLAAAPAFAVSGSVTSVSGADGTYRTKSATLLLSLSPAPDTALTTGDVAAVYGDPLTTTTGFVEVSRTGTGPTSSAVYRLSLATTSTPAPDTIAVSGTILGYGRIPATTITLSRAGLPDATFASPSSLDANAGIAAIAVQPDGKILLGGTFTSYGGTSVGKIVRLNANGTLDSDFLAKVGTAAGTTSASSTITVLALQSDGKILVGGSFTAFSGVPARGLVRLSSDGSVDTSFADGYATVFASGAVTINALGLQSDGRIIAGGTFLRSGTPTLRNVLRLEPSGALEPSFTMNGASVGDTVRAIAVAADDSVVLGGRFAAHILRLLSTGKIDTAFSANRGGKGFNPASSTLTQVTALAVQADGAIVVGGTFVGYNATATGVNGIARLSSDGRLDAAFTQKVGSAFSSSARINALAVQSDGAIVVGGSFSAFNGTSGLNRLLRLRSTGSLDDGFRVSLGTGFDAEVLAVSASTSTALVGGIFTTLDGVAARGVTRIRV